MSEISAFAMYHKKAMKKNSITLAKKRKRGSTTVSLQNGISKQKSTSISKKFNTRKAAKSKDNSKGAISNDISEKSEVTQSAVFMRKKSKPKYASKLKEPTSAILSPASPKSSSSNGQDHMLQVFEWMIAPVKPADFFQAYWEKTPLCIKRKREDYYSQILTTEKLDTILRENSLFYTRNVDVVSYVDGKRETHNSEGRAVPAALWDYYRNGCSIRVLNPQTYCQKLHTLLATLQEYFGCMAGVNTYLTPPGSQGFAPHYDDIEAFVLQLEGRKHWKLYAPLTKEEVLPRVSSKNFDRSELKAPMKEITLNAGDLLYFPRGVIHEGWTDPDAHSLHITVSVYQKTAYIDLMENILKPALAAAAQDDVAFREGLPLQYLQHVGWANQDSSSTTRKETIEKVQQLFGKMMAYVSQSVDGAADQLGKKFMWDAMPPVPSKKEKLSMVHADGERMSNGKTFNKREITLKHYVRLLRYHCLQVTKETDEEEEGTLRLYYCTENAKYYHGEEQQFLVIDEALAPLIKYLIHSYPRFVRVKSLPLKDDEVKMQIVSDLWERGLLVMQEHVDGCTP